MDLTTFQYWSSLLFISVVGIVVFPAMVASIGVNYGQIANNLPLPQNIVPLVKSIGATKVKLYNADPRVLKACICQHRREIHSGSGEQVLGEDEGPGQGPSLGQDQRPGLSPHD
ncbi:glucan endo-1,3-beta-glucosidase 11-like [Corylus avellana]|uniref:glucan endo-1,3-beta-glucosidase 11-like n=1 Tax=Corylus avellana TaxID=13451 RepID=UPI00286D695A|nr:glucan endo-1,3-beta-glucosidase 11-like [Corylus avellana]